MKKNYLKLFLAFTAIIILGFIYFKYDPINTLLFPKCPLYATTGIYCPGCGSQRATHALFHLDIIGAFKSNLLFLPAIFVVSYHYGTKIINHYLGTDYKSILDYSKATITVLIVIVLFFILRNIPVVPFSYLAPH